MIYTISGSITQKIEQGLVIQVGGVGFLVSCASRVIERARIGEKIKLFTYFYAEHFELFGFSQKDELDLFGLLISVSGIGPRNALKIMNAHSAQDIRTMIALEQPEDLARGAGIGTKTAARVVLELRGKVQSAATSLKGASDHEAVSEALKVLGYTKNDIAYALKHLSSNSGKLEEKVKQALRLLAKRYA